MSANASRTAGSRIRESAGSFSHRTPAFLIALAVALVAILSTGHPRAAHGVSPAYTTRGIPMNGQVLFGSSSGNSSQDPLPREAAVQGKFGIHRTYWAGTQVSGSVSRASQDIQAGRLPWLSYSMPPASGTSTQLSWAQMASGAGDTWARDLAARLGTLPGPVWVAVNHEPENDSGNLQDWKRMQQRLSPIFRAYPNIAFTIILMGYHQFTAPTIDPKLSIEALYPGPGLVDVVGIDPYNWYGTLRSTGEQITTFTELKTYYTKIAAWAASAGGVKWAVAETGYTDLAAQKDVAWLSRAYDEMKAAGGIALTYWDDQSTKPANTFRLASTLKQTEFAKILARSNRLNDPVAVTVPKSPTGLTGTAQSSSSASLSWSGSTGATSYAVLRNGVQVATTGGTAYTDSGLSASTSYIYSVRAVNSAGSSAPSGTVSVTTKAATTTTTTTVAFRAASTGTGNGTAATVTLPAQIQPGDTMVLFISTNTGVAPSATAPGWTKAGERLLDDLRTVVWTRAAGATDASSALSVPLPSMAKYDLTLVAYSGANGARPLSVVAGAAEVTSKASHATPSVSVPDSASVVLSYWVDKSSTTSSWTLPSGQLRRAANIGSGSGRLTSVAADTGRIAAAGTWASISATASAPSSKALMWSVGITSAR